MPIALLSLVVWIVVLGLIFWLLLWAIQQVPMPEPFATAARVLLVLAAVLVLVYLLVGVLPPPHGLR